MEIMTAPIRTGLHHGGITTKDWFSEILQWQIAGFSYDNHHRNTFNH
jgi:hypothetical protein